MTVGDDLTPVVEVWPACSTCGLAWVLRRALPMRQGEWLWLWNPDCKCRRATCTDVVIHDERVAS